LRRDDANICHADYRGNDRVAEIPPIFIDLGRLSTSRYRNYSNIWSAGFGTDRKFTILFLLLKYIVIYYDELFYYRHSTTVEDVNL